MVNTKYTNAWIDRYLRNELTESDQAHFEVELLESKQLQDDLEAALAVWRALELQASIGDKPVQAEAGKTGLRTPWIPAALAASLLVAVLGVVMYWNVSHEMANIRTGLQELGESRALEVIVPLDVMRSAGPDLPEAIILKPGRGEFITLDIELSPAARQADSLQMVLRDPDGPELARWHARAGGADRVRASFDSDFLPEGQMWLEMRDPEGRVLDRRLIEFR